ncbi:penicillin-binding protein [Geoalkalibacter ferrihydriticus DSM 17813]|uniref:Penicillin-binding protein 1A n=2 Tax=Geoalkalibacter ferrihydriticus TaxID=392333 RepID=A0A0C2DXN0_9BACT|nr:PBP1A family penicillin-binding protein [Geoalkalibacter ferrihydriticus]KIH78214.1 penicillin-binding protein [Geoalkalibacter ferrihydriticus DSM 17813]
MSIGRLLKYLSLLLLFMVVSAAGLLAAAYVYVAGDLPRVDTLSDYRPPIITRVYSDDGAVIAEYSRERRILVPVERLPQQLVNAFVAAEDSQFFRHQGIDFISIVRAAIRNLQAGGIVQGGSTITQQVAKSMLLTPERKFSRKFKEAILAWRMEQRLSKEGILYLYLNQIYLGHAAYGVQAAAENYFNKDVQELTLAECAMLAGLPQAPSRFSPYRNFSGAKERQRYVLNRMADEGFISADEARAAFAEELTIHPRVNRHIAGAAYFTEQVRRYLEQNYGEDLLYNGGLEVHTSMNLGMQQAAQAAVRDNLRDHDKRRGYRGPLRVLAPAEVDDFLLRQQESLDSAAPEADTLHEAVLTGSDERRLRLRLGARSGTIERSEARWAGTIEVVAADRPAAGNANGGRTRLPLGSVVQVRITKVNADGSLSLALEQEPLAQGALIALDPRNGLVRAMVGGYDFGTSQFNRTIQARRLPGSAIKPLIYAAALDRGYTPATLILDNPVIYREVSASGEETEWRPKNYDDKFIGQTSFREALALSRNVVTIKILEDIGLGYALNYARKLGIEAPLPRDLTLALGSAAMTPMELTSAYSVFASGGVRTSPSYIVRIKDRDGRVLESIDPGDFPMGLGAGQRLLGQSPERVISPTTAYLVTNLLESAVQDGTGQRAKVLNRPVAGKTGTTNELKDAWFIGYVPQLVAASWVGYDQERSLGRYETGARAAAPAWISFMQEAVRDLPPAHFPVPDSIEFRPIDPRTGLLTTEDAEHLRFEAFAPGSAPTRYSMDEKDLKAQDFFRLDLEDLY